MAQLPLNAPVGVKYAHFSGAVTTQVIKATPGGAGGLLDGIMLNAVTGGTSTITLYDSATAAGAGTGNIIAAIAVGSSYVAPGGISYGLNFVNGLVITTVGASTDVTVMYK